MSEKLYIITYSLKATNWNYNRFYNSLQNIGMWWHYLDSTWIIKSSLTAQQIYSMLGPGLSVKDFILVVEINPDNRYGYLPQKAWSWIDNNLN